MDLGSVAMPRQGKVKLSLGEIKEKIGVVGEQDTRPLAWRDQPQGLHEPVMAGISIPDPDKPEGCPIAPKCNCAVIEKIDPQTGKAAFERAAVPRTVPVIVVPKDSIDRPNIQARKHLLQNISRLAHGQIIARQDDHIRPRRVAGPDRPEDQPVAERAPIQVKVRELGDNQSIKSGGKAGHINRQSPHLEP